MDFKVTLSKFVRPTQDSTAYAALEAGRQAKFAEDYDRALQEFDRARQLAQAANDRAVEIASLLHKSEVMIRLARWDDAESLVQQAQALGQTDGERSYCLSMSGMIKQERGNWADARTQYEQALDLARKARDVGAEGRALGHLGGAYLHDQNASYAARLLQDALTKLTSIGYIELNCYFTGLLGQAMIQNGQESEGQHLLDRALRLAEQSHYRIYQRYWALVLGDSALDAGRAQDAHAYYSLNLRLFAPESTAPEFVIVLTHMSKACSSLRRYDEALSHAQIARETAEKLGDTALERQAEGALGVALRGVGRSDEAIPYLQKAADVPDVQVDVLRSLAAAQADSGDTDAAIATYGRAMKQAESAGKDLEAAQARRDLGLVYLRRRDLNAAISNWTAALSTYEIHHAHAQIARLYCDVGNARKALGQRARSMKDYEQALMVLNSLNGADQETRGLVLSNAANAYADQGDVESADAFFTEAINIAERLGDRVAESTRSGNYGWFLLLVGRPRRALATLERALTISQSLNLPLQTAVQLDNLGLVYDSLADYPQALERHRKALELVNDPGWKGQIQVNLANTLISLTQYDEAQSLLDEALNAGRTSANNELMISALTAKARLAIVRQQAASADEALTEAILLARKIDHRRLLAEALSMRSQQQAALERPGESAATWEEAQKLYAMLHMPQAKYQPTWLAKSATHI